MKKRALAAAAAITMLAPLGALASAGVASAAPGMSASVQGYIVRNGDGTASVTARYVCPAGFHLWVSAKQSSDGRPDQRLRQGGSSAIAGAWLQSHPENFTCDGTRQVQTFTIDTEEQGFGELKRGVAWVQFCLLVDDELLISESRWVVVR